MEDTKYSANDQPLMDIPNKLQLKQKCLLLQQPYNWSCIFKWLFSSYELNVESHHFCSWRKYFESYLDPIDFPAKTSGCPGYLAMAFLTVSQWKLTNFSALGGARRFPPAMSDNQSFEKSTNSSILSRNYISNLLFSYYSITLRLILDSNLYTVRAERYLRCTIYLQG